MRTAALPGVSLGLGLALFRRKFGAVMQSQTGNLLGDSLVATIYGNRYF